MGFTCFRCLKSVGGDMQQLFHHLKYVHHITSGSATRIICHQNGCLETFSYCSSFKRHLISQHCSENIELQIQSNDEAADFDDDEDFGTIEHESLEHRDLTSDEELVQDPREHIKMFIKTMMSSAVPSSFTQNVISEVEELVHTILNSFERDATSLVNCTTDDDRSACFENLRQNFQAIRSSFNGLRTLYQRNSYLQKESHLITPLEKLVGRTFTSRTNSTTGEIMQVETRNTYQYVPIDSNLRTFLQQPGVLGAILNEEKSDDPNVLKSFRDGESVTEKLKGEDSGSIMLPILLYNDAFETANPLGSHRGIHKLTCFYASILSLPAMYQANLNNILLVACAKCTVLSEYGIDCVLSTVVKDLNRLQKEGIEVSNDELSVKVKPYLFQVIGDNLGQHETLGYVMNFVANHPCRFCRAHRDTLRSQLVEDPDLLRTERNYEEDAALDDVSKTGIKRRSALNNLSGYHVTQNVAPDVMHDMLEGVLPLEIKLTLKHLIEEHLFTLQELNGRISAFSYGQVDKKNKPSAIGPSALNNPGGPSGQKAVQTMCLAIYLPLIIGDLVPEGSDVWEVYLLLLDIYKTIMSDTISRGATYSLKHMIRDHHSLFLQVHSDRHLSPKQHHMVHYPRAIRLLGPLQQYSSMRYEAKHRPFKKWAAACNNYRNIAKTVSIRHQQQQSCILSDPTSNPTLKYNVDVQNQVLVSVKSLEEASVICASLKVAHDTVVAVASMAEVHGYQLQPSNMVLTTWTEDGPQFAEVLHILVNKGCLFVTLRPWLVKAFKRHFHAFGVQRMDGGIMVKRPEDLFDYRPLHVMRSHDERDDSLYIAIRFNLL